MEQMTSDLEDESVSGSDLDRKLADLRKEVSVIVYGLSGGERWVCFGTHLEFEAFV